MPKLPKSFKYEDLKRTHADYDFESWQVRQDLYDGGKGFKKRIDSYLDKRPIEQMAGAGKNQTGFLDKENPSGVEGFQAEGMGHFALQQWNMRKKVSRYIPYVSGLVDFLVKAAFHVPPTIVAEDDKSGYWESLNDNANGKDTDLGPFSRRISLDTNLHNAGFVTVRAPDKNKPKELRLGYLRSSDVDNWERDGDQYKWIRTYKKQLGRSKDFGGQDKIIETWTYITPEEVGTYRIKYDKDDKPNNEEDIKGIIKEHDLKRLPAFPVRIIGDVIPMERLREPALNLFNSDAALVWSRNQTAYPMPVLKTEAAPDSLISSELAAMQLRPNESFGFEGASPAVLDALYRDRDKRLQDLFIVLNAMAITAAATQVQNPRQATGAKELDREPLALLIESLAHSVRETLIDVIKAIKKFRGDKFEVSLQGLDKVSSNAIAEDFERIQKATETPGYPQAAMQQQIQDAALKSNAHAPASVKQKIIQESKETGNFSLDSNRQPGE